MVYKYLHKDRRILGNQVYFGNGCGCGTLFFKSIRDFKKIFKKRTGKNIEQYIVEQILQGKNFNNIKLPPELQVPEELCLKCQNHYSIYDERYRQFPPFNCRNFKKEITGEDLDAYRQ